MAFTDKIRELRKSRGLTQQQTAKLLGISLSSYQKYEREKSSVMPSINVIIKIAEEFQVSVDYLLGLPDRSDILKTDETDVMIKELYDRLIAGISNMSEDEKLVKLKAICAILES